MPDYARIGATSLQIGTSVLLSLAAATGLYVVGAGQFTSGITVGGTVTASGGLALNNTGGVIDINGDTRIGFVKNSFSSFKATIPYPTNFATNSGVLIREAKCIFSRVSGSTSKLMGAFIVGTGTGAAIHSNFNNVNVPATSGAVIAYSTGSNLRWGKSQNAVFTLSATPTTTNGECIIEFEDTEDTRT